MQWTQGAHQLSYTLPPAGYRNMTPRLQDGNLGPFTGAREAGQGIRFSAPVAYHGYSNYRFEIFGILNDNNHKGGGGPH